MKDIVIKVINPVFSQIQGEKPLVKEIVNKIKQKEVISFSKEYWRKTWGKGKVKQIYLKHMISNDGIFLTGLVNIIADFLTEEDYNVLIKENKKQFIIDSPKLNNITLREEQEEIRKEACVWGTGVIKASTGSGKTVIAGSIISSYIQANLNFKVLFLCHTISLLNQTAEEFNNKLGITSCRIGGKSKDKLTEQVVIGTIQSVSKMELSFLEQFDMVIVDEVHRVNSEDSQYYKTLIKITASLRFGFTATLPSTKEGRLVLEGLIGPVIGSPDIKKEIADGILAKPFLKLIVVPKRMIEEKKYQDIYDICIVDNIQRNILIRDEAIALAKEGKTTLIYVSKITHIENLLALLKDKVKVKVVYGITEGIERELLRKELQQKEVQVVIASVVWKEGINIPSLNTIIMGGGGKAEIAVLQTIGRGLRVFEGKNSLLIIDFLDPGKYLAAHSLERIRIYTGRNFMLSGVNICNPEEGE